VFKREAILNGHGGKYVPFYPATGTALEVELDMAWVSGSAPDNFATNMTIAMASAVPSTAAGDGSVAGPWLGFIFVWDTDQAATRSVAAKFRNAAGTYYTTAWIAWGAVGSTAKTLRASIVGSTGYLHFDGVEQSNVAVSGVFATAYDKVAITPTQGTAADEGDNIDAQTFALREIRVPFDAYYGATAPVSY
jgi:hypothetical protein